MISHLRALRKFVIFAAYTAEYLFAALVIRRRAMDSTIYRKRIANLIQKSSQKTLRLMNVQVAVKDLAPEEFPLPGCLLVSNHLGYLDVLVLASRFPGLFVTSIEVRDTPFLGLLSKLGACLYVERRSRQNLSEEIKDITVALGQGHNVLIFPEATSTDGTEVLRFRRPLFQACIDAATDILPLTINYVSISRRSFQQANRNLVCWYGDMPFLSHLWALFAQKEVTVLVTKHAHLSSKDQTKDSLATLAHQSVASHFQSCPAEIESMDSSSKRFSRSFTRDSILSTESPA